MLLYSCKRAIVVVIVVVTNDLFAFISLLLSLVYLTLSEESEPAPYPKLRARSFPVPSGNRATAGGFSRPILSIVLRTQLKSKPNLKILN